uniref:Uncharacterized protein n=1 Tax=Cacopsylla melanoneura TaxID=428564 RepID=A0A8D9A2L3_9HEMI
MRTSPFWKFPNITNRLDMLLKQTLECILNVKLEESAWVQSSLPINQGGLGIRRLEDICLPAFLSSVYGSSSLVSAILPPMEINNVSMRSEALDCWKNIHGDDIPKVPMFQKSWDDLHTKRIIETKLIFNNTTDSARFKAFQKKESNAWLHALPSSSVATLLDDNSFRICVALRLGCRNSNADVVKL